MKTDRTNSTSKGRLEATLTKVGNVETWFKREIDFKYCVGEGGTVTKKGEREKGTHRGRHKRKVSPKPLVWKMRGAEFHKSMQPTGLKVWRFEGQWAWLG